jgi:tetratricopeptide (TPR) repeat protein
MDMFVPAMLAMLVLVAPAFAENDGQADLDEATGLKVTAEGINDVNKVIDLLDSAIEKGLDEANQKFAQELLISTLLQRAKVFANAIRTMPITPTDNRWMQIRQFALTDLQRAVMLDNGQWEAHLLIGQLHLLGEANPASNAFAADAARRAFSEVIKRENVPDKELAEALALRGALHTDSEKRLQDFNRAVELQPHEHKYLLLRAKHFYGADDFEAALADVDRAMELNPDDAALYDTRGKILLGLERFDEAEASFEKAGDLAPDSLVPYHHLGEAYLQQGETQKAIEQLGKALEVKPDDPATLLIRASVHYQAGDVDAALADIDQLLSINPGIINAATIKACELKANILAAEQRFDEALEVLNKLLTSAPNRPELAGIQYRVASLHLINDQPQQAVEAFAKVLQWDDDNAEARQGRGDAYLRMGKHSEAIEDFNVALEENAENESVLNNLAWVLATSPIEECRDGQRAVELATEACELTAYEAPHILSTLAAAFAETGDFENAIKYSQQAVEKGQNDPSLPQLTQELESYKQQKPWRELQQVGETEEESTAEVTPNATDQTFAPPSAPPAPARTSDF